MLYILELSPLADTMRDDGLDRRWGVGRQPSEFLGYLDYLKIINSLIKTDIVGFKGESNNVFGFPIWYQLAVHAHEAGHDVWAFVGYSEGDIASAWEAKRKYSWLKLYPEFLLISGYCWCEGHVFKRCRPGYIWVNKYGIKKRIWAKVWHCDTPCRRY